MLRPDYGNSIANLAAALGTARGAAPGHYPAPAALAGLSLTERPLALLVLDGLGDEYLARFPDSRLARQRVGRLSSVFPTTTASAITTFATGVAPQQHAITGWFTWLRELGAVATILPFHPRHGGAAFGGVEPGDFIGAAPLAGQIEGPVHALLPAYIADSPYSRASLGPATRHAFGDLDDMFARLARLLAGGEPYVFAYWAEFDAVCHHYGIDSPEAEAQFQAIDAAFGRFLDAIEGSGALVVATADHGLIDAGRCIQLEDHPGLARCLTLPLCGEPRTAYCYLRPARVNAFLDYVSGELGEVCELLPSAQLLEEGWFGRGEPHPALADRIGDYVLMMKERFVIRDRLPTERPFSQLGVHGGASSTEMYVPLIVAEP